MIPSEVAQRFRKRDPVTKRSWRRRRRGYRRHVCGGRRSDRNSRSSSFGGDGSGGAIQASGNDSFGALTVTGTQLVLRPLDLPAGVAEWTVEFERVGDGRSASAAGFHASNKPTS